MRVLQLALLGAAAVLAQEPSGSPLVDVPDEIANATTTAKDLPPPTEGIVGAGVSGASFTSAADSNSTTSVDPAASTAAEAGTASVVTPSGSDPSGSASASASGAASPMASLDMFTLVGPAMMIVGAVGAGFAVI
ncbi:hypothetical protein BD324DRAFT_648549 [Kockovaella imperatae]|uniref:Uncharacterized protein n=1 Tax=Kockovaella imperatae TaxID=4999 RepID=A0A1Y1UPH4_9TREE|nr:hypothetical protein BD324DRAFT_648549 [Kockovaella imperatae]ORX39931.1 hypothetical protein BD324DRAFT_648549 [Kockovaella imperatae]